MIDIESDPDARLRTMAAYLTNARIAGEFDIPTDTTRQMLAMVPTILLDVAHEVAAMRRTLDEIYRNAAEDMRLVRLVPALAIIDGGLA